MSTPRVAIASSFFLVALTGHLLAATVQVGACRNGLPSFATIQSAVNTSSAGTTILICPGTYPEQVVIKKA
jgi:pectin methylesterase-like acyl-CoA thioesterase